MLPTPDLTTDLNTAPTTTKQSKKGISKAHKPNVAQYMISKTFVTDPTIATVHFAQIRFAPGQVQSDWPGSGSELL